MRYPWVAVGTVEVGEVGMQVAALEELGDGGGNLRVSARLIAATTYSVGRPLFLRGNGAGLPLQNRYAGVGSGNNPAALTDGYAQPTASIGRRTV